MQSWRLRLAVVRVCGRETPDSPSRRTPTAPARQGKGAAESCRSAAAAAAAAARGGGGGGGGVPCAP